MNTKSYPAVKINQWQNQWDELEWDTENYRRKPNPFFYILSMSAKDLIKLSNVYARDLNNAQNRAEDLGIQRMHNKNRSKKIKEFIKYGYPYCDFNAAVRADPERIKMKKPGWLPTGIVINLLHTPKIENDLSTGVVEEDQIHIEDLPNSNIAEMRLPNSYNEKSNWTPTYLSPIEIIDGQHRLFAFKDDSPQGYTKEAEEFYFPVIAFIDLDVSWQAYLFWSINVSPEKINPSLAYDMYPLLRTEDWLEDNPLVHKIYREARAQEIVEVLWSYPNSPWYRKINMLGEKGSPYIKQTTWVRALVKAFFKREGLFHTFKNRRILPWSRPQQAAFIIYLGQKIFHKIELLIENDKDSWPNNINSNTSLNDIPLIDVAWSGKKSLLNMDSGIHALCMVINEYFCDPIKFDILAEWKQFEEFDNNLENVEFVLKLLPTLKNIDELGVGLNTHIDNLTSKLASFDWRSSQADSLTDEERQQKQTYRGSGGYNILRDHIIIHMQEA